MKESNIPGYPCRRGKVRDVYDIGKVDGRECLIIVTTDRISAYDHVLPTPIPMRGQLLTQMSKFWLQYLGSFDHFLSDQLSDMPAAFRQPELQGRTMMVTKCKALPIECVVRGYLCGSGWADYKKTGEVCGMVMPKNLQENMPFSSAVFTPATKEQTGHDININLQEVQKRLSDLGYNGEWMGNDLMRRAIDNYQEAADYAWERGIIIADTKFEFGLSDAEDSDSIMLIDEVLTPDSSRFWAVGDYRLGSSPPSFDKQYVRDYLSTCGWDRNSPPPELPKEVVDKTIEKYVAIYELLTDEKFTP